MTTEQQAPRALGAQLVVLGVVAVALPLLLALTPRLFNDGDTSWHLAAGRLILDNGAVPAVDNFSFTFAGRPWHAHEWLAEAIMAATHAADGWSGLAFLTAASVTALMLTVGIEVRRWVSPLALAVILLALFATLAPYILARPHVLAWPLLAGWAVLLMRAREAGRAPPLAAAVLMLVWANLHASFIFGLLLIGPFALEALVEEVDKRATILRWGAFGLLSLLLACLTPHGPAGLIFPLQVSVMEALPLISEWRPTLLTEKRNFQLALFATILFALARGLKVPLIRLLLLIALLYLAFEHVRHQALLAILGALLLAEPIGRIGPPARIPAPRLPDSGKLALALAVIVLIVGAARIAVPMERPDSSSNPHSAIAQIPPALRTRPVLNSYGFGGPLILAGIRPYIDGRADMYGDAHILEHDRIVRGDRAAFDAAVRRWDIGWTIVMPKAPLAAMLDRTPGWRRVYADKWAVIHVRDGSSAPVR